MCLIYDKFLRSVEKIWDVHQERLNDKNTEGTYCKYFNQTGEDEGRSQKVDFLNVRGANRVEFLNFI